MESRKPNMSELIDELRRMREQAKLGGGIERIKRQHEAGKLTARERIDLLVDPGTFVETDMFVIHRSTYFDMPQKRYLGDGVVTGLGKIDGRLAAIFSQDFTVFGGSLGEMYSKKIVKLMDLAAKLGIPIIGLNDSGGARIQEGVVSLEAYGEIFKRNTWLSGVIPQIAVIMGPCAGGAVYSPALMDFVIMVRKTSYMFITGPDVVKTATGEDVTFESLGGADVHAEKSGIAHFVAENDEEALNLVKRLLSYIPSNNMEDPPRVESDDSIDRIDAELESIVPSDPMKPFDVREVIRRVVDNGEFFEIHEKWAPNIVVGFARIGGRSVGIVANQPLYMAGVLDIDASDKASRFIRFLDAFNIPIVTFVDVPGYMPGTAQEHGGIIRHGSKMLYAYAEATVPKITVILRKAYGGSYLAMCAKSMGADMVYAWPSAEIAVLGPEAAIKILYRKEIQSAKNPEKFIEEKIEEYRKLFANPYKAAEMGFVDDVIEPRMTRPMIAKALEILETKREDRLPKKHGIIPS
ncbi:MAG: acyl-CoA carboxylase subunit beta [Thermoprotei archaeon]|jgi:acetyl-CoA carboxylase carboxyltransferase component